MDDNSHSQSYADVLNKLNPDVSHTRVALRCNRKKVVLIKIEGDSNKGIFALSPKAVDEGGQMH